MNNHPIGTVLFDGVSKRYRLGALGTLRGTVAGLTRRKREDGPRDFWALRNLSFRVEPGQAMGVIGPNGAGKTTTLKLLSSITQPTSGRVHVSGRTSSLIELGAGFHPELSGRENIFLNGAILGLKRQEIQRKLDAIIAFSELERFADTPVKRYSSGMYVRLGFAVAAHVEPDVLLVDEVLAVGDASFSQKCVARMETLRKQGTTLLFVSHNMYLVQRLCQRSVLLWKGELAFEGPVAGAIEKYEQKVNQGSSGGDVDSPQSMLKLNCVGLIGDRDDLGTTFQHGDQTTLAVDYTAASPIVSPIIRVRLFRNDGLVVAMMATHHQDRTDSITLQPAGRISMTIPSLEVLSGYYFFEVRVMDPTDSQLLAAGRSNDFYVSSPGFGYEIDRGVYRPRVEWATTG